MSMISQDRQTQTVHLPSQSPKTSGIRQLGYSGVHQEGSKMFRRPLRVYLFETLLFLTVATFLLQIGYVLLPVFHSDNTQEPVSDTKSRHMDTVRDPKEGIIRSAESDIEGNGDAAVAVDAPKYRLRKDQLAAEAAAKAGNAVEGAKNEQIRKEEKPEPQNPPANVADVKPPQNQDAKPQNPEPQNPPANAANVNPPQNQGAQPQNPDPQPPKAESKPAVVQPKIAAPPQKEASKCIMTVLVLGGMKIVEEWSELQTLVKFLKQPSHIINEGVTYRAPIYCPKHDCTIELTFSSNFSEQMPYKNAVILNVAPYTLLTQMSKLLKHDNFPDKQLWLLYGVETALRIHKWIKHIGDLRIHGTWSYLSDSEIHMPYAYYQPGEPVTDEVRKTSKYWGQDKTSLVAWMGSNCVKEVFWPRMEYIEELQKHIHLDTYGKCGTLTCLPRLSMKCKRLMNSYKFYLAFENAECDEYISEKMWDTALQHGVVPVVYGALKSDYVRLAPPNSFIYAGDFESPKDLATYLLKLDKRPDLYAEFFEWRYKGRVVQVYPDLEMSKFCEVIPYVNKARSGKLLKKPASTFPWFNSCRNPIVKVFNPHDILPLEDWKPWFVA